MDDITLDFDPRNAWFNTNVAFAQPQPQPMMGSFGPRRIPFVNYTQAPRPEPMVRPQAKFLAAIAQHFKADAQLNAVGTIAGKLIG